MAQINIEQVPVEKKNNKVQQELNAFIDYFPHTYSIFEKGGQVELEAGNTIIDKETLLTGFKEPGKNKLITLCKHLLTNFHVLKLGMYESEPLNERNVEEVITTFKDFSQKNKKKRKPRMVKDRTQENNSTEDEKTIPNEIEKEENIKKAGSLKFEWSLSLDNNKFLSGCISNMEDLIALKSQIETLFDNIKPKGNEAERKDEDTAVGRGDAVGEAKRKIGKDKGGDAVGKTKKKVGKPKSGDAVGEANNEVGKIEERKVVCDKNSEDVSNISDSESVMGMDNIIEDNIVTFDDEFTLDIDNIFDDFNFEE